MFSKEILLCRNINIETAEMDDEVGMLNIDTGKYYVLDAVGRDIWDSLEDPISFEQLVDRLLTIYDVDRKTCEKDTLEFVNDLLENSLIRTADLEEK